MKQVEGKCQIFLRGNPEQNMTRLLRLTPLFLIHSSDFSSFFFNYTVCFLSMVLYLCYLHFCIAHAFTLFGPLNTRRVTNKQHQNVQMWIKTVVTGCNINLQLKHSKTKYFFFKFEQDTLKVSCAGIFLCERGSCQIFSMRKATWQAPMGILFSLFGLFPVLFCFFYVPID